MSAAQIGERSFARSIELSARARAVIAGGVTHDMRFARPHPVYVERALGPHKWDADGNRYVDFWMGHGSLLLGHGRPEVVEAVQRAAARATHPGACHELEVRWAEQVVELIPSAERVRFTASGTEATMLALRLARAATGRDRILKFEGHFHGWHDYATYGVNPPFDRPTSLGVPAALDAVVTVVPPDAERVAAELDRGDVAGAILEPTGASMGVVPLPDGFLAELRRLCDRAGAVLIFDEVVSGFRYAPGGVQALTGVLPDLTTLGKVLAGGLPGGAVAGRTAVMELLAYSGDRERDRFHRVAHTGTFNANPLSAAAGVAALELVADGAAAETASRMAQRLRDGLAEVTRAHEDVWSILGDASIFHWLPVTDADAAARKAARGPTSTEAMRHALLRRGVDFPGYEGWLSGRHSEADIDLAVAAFDDALGELGSGA